MTRSSYSPLAWLVLAALVGACGGSDVDVLPSGTSDPGASIGVRSDQPWFDSMDVDAEQLADGSVCFRVSGAPSGWAVDQRCWAPPFVHVWDLAASGTVGEHGGEPVLASLLITSTDALVDGVEQFGDVASWRQFGPALVVLTRITPSGGAPLVIEYSRAGAPSACSVGPPEAACLPG